MSVLVPPLRPGGVPPDVEPRPAPAPAISRPTVEPADDAAFSTPAASRAAHRWIITLVVPFVIGAAFFALAIGLGSEWPMVPGFLLGPLAMIAGYVYLSLTSDSNSIDA